MGIFPKLKERNSLSIADAQGKTPVRNADWNQYDCPEELSRYPESAQGAVEKDAPAGEESGYNGPTEEEVTQLSLLYAYLVCFLGS